MGPAAIGATPWCKKVQSHRDGDPDASAGLKNLRPASDVQPRTSWPVCFRVAWVGGLGWIVEQLSTHSPVGGVVHDAGLRVAVSTFVVSTLVSLKASWKHEIHLGSRAGESGAMEYVTAGGTSTNKWRIGEKFFIRAAPERSTNRPWGPGPGGSSPRCFAPSRAGRAQARSNCDGAFRGILGH